MNNKTPLHWEIEPKKKEKKQPLPIKTKIAAWWMIILGGVLLLFFLRDLILFLYFRFPNAFLTLIIMRSGLFSILLVSSGLFLLRKKGWAWWLTIASLPIYLIVKSTLVASLARDVEGITPHLQLRHFVMAGSEIIIIIGIILLPLIFLYLDRKNFRKIATQAGSNITR